MGKGIVALGLPGQLMREKVQRPDLAHLQMPACPRVYKALMAHSTFKATLSAVLAHLGELF